MYRFKFEIFPILSYFQGRLEQEIQRNPKYKKRLNSIQKAYTKADNETQRMYVIGSIGYHSLIM